MQLLRRRALGRGIAARAAAAVAALLALGLVWPGMAAAAPLSRPAAAARGDGGPGTVAAKIGDQVRETLNHAAGPGSDDASGALSTVSSVTVHGGYTAAGIGM